jgi:type I restriction enzyme M protein
VNVYEAYEDMEGFSKVADIKTVQANGANLSIPLYVQTNNNNASSKESKPLSETIVEWQMSSQALRKSLNQLLSSFDN